MRGDFSRVTFRPDQHYSGVRLQQGRVQLDAEFNEHVDIDAHRHAETATDAIGATGAPYQGGGYLIGVATRLRDVDVEGTTGWAVGEDALLLRLDGGAWTLAAPPPGTGDLNALALTGTGGLAAGDGGVLLGLSGTTWSPEQLPAEVSADLYGVAVADGEAWAVGDRGSIVHRGTTGPWVVQTPPEGTTVALRGVHFAGVDRGWAVGDGATILATSDGTTWVRQDVPAGTGALHAVFALDDTHAWAVGDGGRILFWNGATWAQQADLPVGVGALRAVRFQDAANGTAVGDGGIVLATGDGGNKWQTQDLAPGRPDLHGLAIDASGTASAVGDDASFTREGVTWSPGPPLPAGKGRSLTLSAGDLYVDGVRVVNERLVSLTGQPDLTFTRPPATAPEREPVFPPPTTNATYGVYLEVFEEHLTALEREELREVALGGPDTATRTRTVWQAKLLELDGPASCEVLEAKLPPGPPRDGRLRARAEPERLPDNECSIAGGGGFRRLENQLYRVEIHKVDPKVTFKWSRDNGMVVTRLEAVEITPGVPPEPGSGSVTVPHPGRDEVLAFGPGDLVELSDETRAQRGRPGLLVQVRSVRGNVLDLEPTSLPSQPVTTADFPVRPTVRRWEGSGDAQPDPENTQPGPWHHLEDGVQVQFTGTSFLSGEHWMVAARSMTGTVEWRRAAGLPLFEEPHGPRRRFAALGLVRLDEDGMWSSPRDCRRRFPPLTGLVNFFYVGGGGQEAMPDVTAQEPPPRFVELDQPLQVGVSNWRWPVEGAQVRFDVLAGGGKLNGEIEDRVTVSTGSNGIASCRWFLRGGNPPSPQTQQVRAALLDEHGEEMQTPVVFDANLSVAAEVAYDGQGCGTLQDQKTVQSAITRLSRLTRIVPLGGTGIDIGPDRPASGQLPVEVLVVNDCGPVEGARVRFTASGGGATEPPIVETSAGRAATTWTLGRAEPTQQVTATLEDPGPGNVLHLPAEVSFVANLSLASDTAYTPACAVLSDARTVQEAIDALAVLPRLLHVSGDGAHAAPGQLVDLEVGVAGDCGPDDRDRVVQFVVRQGDGVLEGPDPTGLVPTSGGRAGCGFRMGTDQRHLIEARLIREGTEAYQPPVFFTITRVTAVQVSYSPQCELLRRADVDNVQDAITALCRRLDPEQASMDLVLQRVSLENVDDAAGGWQFEGGRVLDDGGNQLGHFTSHKRIVANSGARVNAAMLTMTIFIDGPTPPENLTVQGAHSFDNGGENGSVSAASARFAQLIGRPFARSGDRVTIGGAGP